MHSFLTDDANAYINSIPPFMDKVINGVRLKAVLMDPAQKLEFKSRLGPDQQRMADYAVSRAGAVLTLAEGVVHSHPPRGGVTSADTPWEWDDYPSTRPDELIGVTPADLGLPSNDLELATGLSVHLIDLHHGVAPALRLDPDYLRSLSPRARLLTTLPGNEELGGPFNVRAAFANGDLFVPPGCVVYTTIGSKDKITVGSSALCQGEFMTHNYTGDSHVWAVDVTNSAIRKGDVIVSPKISWQTDATEPEYTSRIGMLLIVPEISDGDFLGTTIGAQLQQEALTALGVGITDLASFVSPLGWATKARVFTGLWCTDLRVHDDGSFMGRIDLARADALIARALELAGEPPSDPAHRAALVDGGVHSFAYFSQNQSPPAIWPRESAALANVSWSSDLWDEMRSEKVVTKEEAGDESWIEETFEQSAQRVAQLSPRRVFWLAQLQTPTAAKAPAFDVTIVSEDGAEGLLLTASVGSRAVHPTSAISMLVKLKRLRREAIRDKLISQISSAASSLVDGAVVPVLVPRHADLVHDSTPATLAAITRPWDPASWGAPSLATSVDEVSVLFSDVVAAEETTDGASNFEQFPDLRFMGDLWYKAFPQPDSGELSRVISDIVSIEWPSMGASVIPSIEVMV